MAEIRYAFDEANRHYQTENLAKKADLSTNLALDTDGWQTQTLWRDEKGNVLEVFGEGCGCSLNTYVYDVLERLVTIKDAMPTTPTDLQNKEIRAYDLWGDLTRLTYKEKSQAGGIEADKDIVINFEYDVRHRVTLRSEQIGSGVFADTSYDYGKRDQVTQVMDGAGRTTKYEYNERGWPTKEWVDFSGGLSDHTKDVVTQHIYDLSTRKITYKAANGTTGDQSTIYEYDPLWRLIHTTWPDAEISDYSYDKASNRVGYTDPNNTARVAQYDKNDRLTLQDNTLAANVVGATQLTFDYDALDRITEAQSFEGSTFDVLDAWTYNTLGKPQTEKQVINGYSSGTGRTFTYTWDVNGLRIAAAYPASGSVVSYDRDELGRVNAISLGSIQVVDYTFSGPRIIRKDYPGSRGTFKYDGFGRLTSIVHQDSGDAGTLAEFGYGYDAGHYAMYTDKHYWNDHTGVTITTSTSDKSEQYGYDLAGRLVVCLRGVPSNYVGSSIASNIYYDDKVEYFYDQTGNRLSRKTDGTTDQTCAYNAANEMTAEDSVAQTYTDNGTLAGPSSTYKYDFLDHLARATAGGVTYAYHYDALGRMVQRDHTQSSVRLYYDGWQAVEQINWTTSESLKKVYIFGPQIDELLLYVDIAATPDAYHYAHADRMGSIQVFVGADGESQESYRYKEFGETTIVSSSFLKLGSVDSPIGNPHRYTGRREDIQVGAFGDDWYDYRARTMRPAVGRFLQRDGLGYIDGAGRYLYVMDNPTNFIDPMGAMSLMSDDDYTSAMGPNVAAAWNAAGPLQKVAMKLAYDDATGFEKSHKQLSKDSGAVMNAIRHCILSCDLHTDLPPEVAEQLLNAHEADGLQKAQDLVAELSDYVDHHLGACALPLLLAEDALDRFLADSAIDVNNNDVGRRLAGEPGGSCRDKCADAYNSPDHGGLKGNFPVSGPHVPTEFDEMTPWDKAEAAYPLGPHSP